MTPEGRVKAKVKVVLKREGVYYVMPIGGPFSKVGIGDFLCCVNGKFLSIETKGWRKDQTEMQKFDQEQVARSGGIKLVIHLEDMWRLEQIIKRMREEV